MTIKVEHQRIVGSSDSFTIDPLTPMPPFDRIQRAELLTKVSILNYPLNRIIEGQLQRHPDVERALMLFNAHPFGLVDGGVNIRTGLELTEKRFNIGRHCGKVGFGVTTTLKPLSVSKLLTDAQLHLAEKGGMGHDCLKDLEINRRNDLIARGQDMAGAYSQEAYDSEVRILNERGIEPEVLQRFIAFGKTTGHRSIARFLKVEDGRLIGVKDDDLCALAAHVIDALTYSTKPETGEPEINVFVPAKERMILSMFNHTGDEVLPKPLGYPFLWTEGLAVNETGEIVEVKNISDVPTGLVLLGSYPFLQEFAAKAGAKIFVDHIGLKSIEEPDVTLCNFLNNPSLY